MVRIKILLIITKMLPSDKQMTEGQRACLSPSLSLLVRWAEPKATASMPVHMPGHDILKAESILQIIIPTSWRFTLSVQGSGLAHYMGPKSIF